MAYIYIIRSEQWEEDIYKIGYTKNPINRIKDSCYTTTYYKPCKYIFIYNIELIKNEETEISLTLEYKEKLFHRHMKENSNLNLKNDNNCCNEMYKCKLEILQNQLLNFMQVNNLKYELINYDCILNLRKQYILKEDQSKLIISYGIDNNIIKHETDLKEVIKCSACNVECKKEIYKICYDNIEYNFGSDCIKLNGAKEYFRERNKEIAKNKKKVKKLLKEIMELKCDKHNLTRELRNLKLNEEKNIKRIEEYKERKKLLDKEEETLKIRESILKEIKELENNKNTLTQEVENLENNKNTLTQEVENLKLNEEENIKRIEEYKERKELLDKEEENLKIRESILTQTEENLKIRKFKNIIKLIKERKEYKNNQVKAEIKIIKDLHDEIKNLTRTKIKIEEEIIDFNNSREEIIKKTEEEIKNKCKKEIIKLERLKQS